MIDWSAIDKKDPTAWTKLAELLLQKAMAVIQAGERPAMQAVQADLGSFVVEANSKTPVAALSATNAASRQVTNALVALDITDLATRSAKLDAAGAKVAAVAGTVQSEALKLQLTALRGVLDELDGFAAEVRGFREAIDGIPKKDVPARLDEVLALLAKIQERARAVHA